MSHRPLAFTAQGLLHVLQQLPAAQAYIVGFSGGADSTALLHAINSIRQQLKTPVTAVHVNHGLHENADKWQLECETFCDQNNIELACLKIDLQNRSGKGLEAEARHLRYEAISALLKPGTSLLTAHHADDQAETLLLNLMRGSGVDGLSVMPDSRPLGEGFLQRPMLGFQNTALREYLRVNDIKWTEDPSNSHLNHDRNFVRHEIIPLLEKRWPEVGKRLLLTRRAMTDARRLLERLADESLGQNLAHPLVLNIAPKLLDDPELLKLVIRRWMKKSDAASIPAYRLETFYQQVQQAGSEHKVTVQWDGWSLRLFKQQLWLDADKKISPCATVNWPLGHSEIDLGNTIGRMVFWRNDESGKQADDTGLSKGEICVSGRNDLQKMVIYKGGHHRRLKSLFQEAGIPHWLRDCIPLCKLDGELVSIGDWCFSDQFASWMSENDVKLSWQPRHPLLRFIRKQQHPDKI
jgi:tRNA(Ile)-lysidine synthase